MYQKLSTWFFILLTSMLLIQNWTLMEIILNESQILSFWVISSTLSWNQHIKKISLKISKSIGILYRLRDIYPHAVLENLYNALIIPHFNYCILCWGSVVRENHSLHILQKRALRLITNSNYISHTEPLCKELRVLIVFDMFSVAVWKF